MAGLVDHTALVACALPRLEFRDGFLQRCPDVVFLALERRIAHREDLVRAREEAAHEGDIRVALLARLAVASICSSGSADAMIRM